MENGLKCAIKYKCYRQSFLQTFISVITLKIHRFFGTYARLHYICLTDFNKRKLLELNKGSKEIINKSRVYIKPNFTYSEPSFIPYQNRKNQFVFAGRLDDLKGIKLLLEAWKEIKNSNLLICGIGPEEEWCQKYINENNMTNVKMLGFLPNLEVKKIIGESKALILPTQWYEGFPMTVVESLACGTPVIGSDIGNVGSTIVDGVNGMKFQYNSIVELKDAIMKIYDMSETSRMFYENNLTKEQNYKTLSEIYNKVIYT